MPGYWWFVGGAGAVLLLLTLLLVAGLFRPAREVEIQVRLLNTQLKDVQRQRDEEERKNAELTDMLLQTLGAAEKTGNNAKRLITIARTSAEIMEIRRDFAAALGSAFPTKGALAQMLKFQLDESLAAIAGSDNLVSMIYDLVVWAEARGKLYALLEASLKDNPANPALVRFQQKYDGHLQ